MIKNGTIKTSKIFLGNKKVRKVYNGEIPVYSAGNIAAYNIDSAAASPVIYTKEVTIDDDCLDYKYLTFEYKNVWQGWNFEGWKENKSPLPDDYVTKKIMKNEPLSFYGLYSAPVTVSYYANGGIVSSGVTTTEQKTRYYNNGNLLNPSFTLKSTGFTRAGYTLSGWYQNSVGGAIRNPGDNISFSANAALYAVWKLNDFKNISLSDFQNLFQTEYQSHGADTGYVYSGSPIGSDQTGSAVWKTAIDFSKIITIRIYYGAHIDYPNGTGFDVYRCSSTASLGTKMKSVSNQYASISPIGQYVDIDVTDFTGTGYIGIKGHVSGSYTKIGKIQYR